MNDLFISVITTVLPELLKTGVELLSKDDFTQKVKEEQQTLSEKEIATSYEMFKEAWQKLQGEPEVKSETVERVVTEIVNKKMKKNLLMKK